MPKGFFVQFSDALFTRLREEAARREIPMTQLVREALKKYLEK